MSLNGTAVEAPQKSAPDAAQAAPGSLTVPVASVGGDQSASTPASPGQEGVQSPANDWFRRGFNQIRFGAPAVVREADGAPPARSESDGPDGQPAQAQPSSEGAGEQPAATPKDDAAQDQSSTRAARTYTEDEFKRAVQSETDRVLAKHQREEAARRRQEERKQLREKDPYAFAQADREAEAEAEALQQQLARANELASSALHAYDASVLDPLMGELPEIERNAILESISEGIPGRGQAATKAITALKKQWHDRGVSSARKVLLEDQGFIKEVLARYGGQRTEPDNIPAVAAPTQGFSMDGWLRREASRVRGH